MRQVFYNPSTNHLIEDISGKSIQDILASVGKLGEIENYQAIVLNDEEENKYLKGQLTLVKDENNRLQKTPVSFVQIQTEAQKAREALQEIVLAKFPAIADHKKLTNDMIDKSLLPEAIKGLLYLMLAVDI